MFLCNSLAFVGGGGRGVELVSESRERCSFDCGILFLVLFLFGVLGQGGGMCFLGIMIVVFLVIYLETRGLYWYI